MTDEIIYDRTPSAGWLANEAKIKAKAVVQHVVLPDTDDIVELARAAIPALVRRAVALAHESDSLNAVVGVLNALADRAYGKPTQGIEHSGTLTLAALVEQSLALPSVGAAEGAQDALEPIDHISSHQSVVRVPEPS